MHATSSSFSHVDQNTLCSTLIWFMGAAGQKKQDGQLMTACMLVEGVKMHKFGMDLKTNEKEWLVQEISSFLQIPCEQPTSSNQPFLNIVDAYDQRTGSSDAWNGE
jgi:hypothetical protein